MPYFGRESRHNLRTCDPQLQRLFERVIQIIDCKILCGHRGEAAQNRAFDEGHSRVRWPDGKHNTYPSEGIDAAPWPIDWEDRPRFYFFAGIVLGVAEGMEIPLRWGGDWDGDRDFRDQTFDDLVHFELK